MLKSAYDLCDMTVTVYRREEDQILRRVYDRAFFDIRKSRGTGKEGDQESTAFLLVIPGQEQAVYPQDKVLLGIGPEVGSGDWGRFIPALVPGLAVVSHVDVKYRQGKPVHTEAGGSLLRFQNLDQNR